MWYLSPIDFCWVYSPSRSCLSVCTHDNYGSGLAAHPYASHHPRLRDHYKSLQLSACIHRHSLRSTFDQLSAHLIVRHASHPQQHHIPRTYIPCIGGCHGCDRRTADRVNRGCPAASCARALVHADSSCHNNVRTLEVYLHTYHRHIVQHITVSSLVSPSTPSVGIFIM